MNKLNFDINSMGGWEQKKALYLLQQALELCIEIGYGELAVNQSSGYTYLWLEYYPFTLYMPINCDLSVDDIWAMWTNPEDGEVEEIPLGKNSLSDLYNWVKTLEEQNE